MSKIVLEDFNEGDGYYKVFLAYLTKEQVEEIEALVSRWGPTDEDIKNCIGMCLTDVNEQRFKDYGTNLKACLAWLEKQGEQKPTDKVKPKFKVGDWCMDNEDGTIFQIVKVLDNTYTYRTIEGKEYSCTHYSLENDARLWTIQDAKDGDVLVHNNSLVEIILLFEKWMNGVGQGAYSYAHAFNNKILFNNWSDCGYSVHPATKEQRDHLFAKMKEAGYEWDNEKKELKKVEKWSEEDERIYQSIIDDIVQENQLDSKQIDWLKSLKKRMGNEKVEESSDAADG